VHETAQTDWYAAANDLPSWSGPPLPPPQARQRQPQAGQSQAGQPPRRISTRNTPASPPPATPAASGAARARIVDLDAERPLPSIERAISAPGGRRDFSWRRRVKVVAGGQGPGKRDQESLDRDRARLALSGPRWIVVLGCGSGAGQTKTTLMTGRMLASLRQHPVAALTAATGTTRVASVASLLNGRKPAGQGNGLEVIADDGNANPEDYQRLASILGDRYPLTIVDHSPAGMSRVLNVADQLLIVVPANPEAASSLASTQQWLEANGYGTLAARAVTLVNGVRKDMMSDVLRAESVARGRCRAIVRVPWDDPAASLQTQTRVAYTALAGVLIAGLAAATTGGSPGEHEG
jgi:hypothetical protein